MDDRFLAALQAVAGAMPGRRLDAATVGGLAGSLTGLKPFHDLPVGAKALWDGWSKAS